MSDELEFKVVTYGNAFEETPEGFYYMEQIRRATEEYVATLGWEREIVAEIDAEIDRLVFYGEQST